MALKIDNPAVVRLTREVAALAGENEMEAIRRALEERQGRLLMAPFRSRVLNRKEVRELLCTAPGPWSR
jgi:hypothetical protein